MRPFFYICCHAAVEVNGIALESIKFRGKKGGDESVTADGLTKVMSARGELGVGGESL
jgi:hypothetical protein